MEPKEVSTVRKITGELIGELIGGFIVYGIIYGILYSIIYSLIIEKISTDSLMPQAIIAIILQGLFAFAIWRVSIKTTFRKRSILQNDVPKVIKNMFIFTVILCVISTFSNYLEVKEKVEKIEDRVNIYTSYMYDDAKEETEEALEEAKSELYTYLTVLELGLFAAYMAVVPLQKKAILENSVLG